jgi:hypothetical protein
MGRVLGVTIASSIKTGFDRYSSIDIFLYIVYTQPIIITSEAVMSKNLTHASQGEIFVLWHINQTQTGLLHQGSTTAKGIKRLLW